MDPRTASPRRGAMHSATVRAGPRDGWMPMPARPLYTDGVTESTSPGWDFFDPDRVRRWLTDARDEDARG